MPTGAYGLPVCESATGRTFLLTAAHVVGSLSWAHPSHRMDVLLAANSGVPGSGDPTIGHVHLSHPPEPCEEVELDASLIAAVNGVTLNDIVRDECLSGIARDVEATAVDDNPVIVYKRGIREPKLTSGLLEPFAISALLESQLPDGTRALRRYLRVFRVYGDEGPFAKPGDSGSVVIDADDCVVGVLVGLGRTDGSAVDENTPGIVVPIIDILDTLDLELLGPQRPCTVV
jgi:Trypsin